MNVYLYAGLLLINTCNMQVNKLMHYTLLAKIVGLARFNN